MADHSAKPQATVSIVESDHDNRDVEPVSRWIPGYMQQFPYVGAVAVLCIAIMAAMALGVLCGSNGVSTSVWPQKIAPNVVLSMINAVSSLALTIAVGEGVAIAWWRHAMKGSTVAELHHQWQLSTGVFNMILKPKSLLTSSIALAVLATQVTLLNSILYQRATSTYTGSDPPKTMTGIGIAAQEFPMTGYVVSNDSSAQSAGNSFMIGDSFNPVVNTWETSNGFWQGYNEMFRFSKHRHSGSAKFGYCNGVCYTTLQAVGFEIDCTDRSEHTDIGMPAIEAYNNSGPQSAYTNLPIFNSSFVMEYSTADRDYPQIVLDLQYFQSDDAYNAMSTTCPGTVFTKQCSLRPALVQYPVKVTNFTNKHVVNGVSLEVQDNNSDDQIMNVDTAPPPYDSNGKQAQGFKIVDYLYPKDTNTMLSLTALGGIANAFAQHLSSLAAITYTGDSWSLLQQGTLAQTMMYGPPNMGTCDCSFRSTSLDSIIASINQLTFLTATGMIDTTSFKGLTKSKFPSSPFPEAPIIAVDSNLTASFFKAPTQAIQLTDVVHYRSHFVYAGIAFGITILCIILVIPSFWQYGELGRRVTLGPVEIASAFGAPILVDNGRNETKNDGIDTLIKNIGNRRIVYGFVDVDGDGVVDDVKEMHLAGVPVAGKNVVDVDGDHAEIEKQENAAVASPALTQGSTGAEGERVLKRRSVRLAMGPPEQVRPTSQVFPMQKSPALGSTRE